MFDLVITKGRVVTANFDLVLDIGIKDEKIAALATAGSLADQADAVIDASSKFVFPGGVDSHVHFDTNLSQYMTAQSAEAGSRAGIWGGTTTYLDFSFQAGSQGLVDSIQKKLKITADQPVHADYALHAMLTGAFPLSINDELDDAISGGVNGFKMFTTFGADGSVGGMFTDDGRIYSVMRHVADSGDGNVLIHAEDDCVIDFHVRALTAAGRSGIQHIHEARPNLAEEAAVGRMLLLAKRTGCPLYIVHISTHEAVEAIDRARYEGTHVTAEVLHNQLEFSPDVYAKQHGAMYMNYPPFKSNHDRQELWKGLQAERIHTVASDDFAIPWENKISGSRIDNATGGHNGIETRMLYLFSEGVAAGRITPQQFVQTTAANPAKIFGIHPQKGDIAVGSDADLIIIDPAATTVIRQEELHSDIPYSVWNGRTFNGALTTIILRGHALVSDGAWVGPATGIGRFVPSRRPSLI